MDIVTWKLSISPPSLEARDESHAEEMASGKGLNQRSTPQPQLFQSSLSLCLQIYPPMVTSGLAQGLIWAIAS
ncbi:hypothetical protein NQZ68_016145 [Dissostichus eleginoides]|nr:hypothetical protein NQZ68_016145 [Dissostichus eleginoides]